MFSDPAFLAAAFIAVLLVGLAKGGFSGIGMAATPLLALTMPPLQALAILLPPESLYLPFTQETWAHIVQAVLFGIGVLIMIAFIRGAQRIEPFTRRG